MSKIGLKKLIEQDNFQIGLINKMKETVSKELLTEERIKKIIPEFRKAISFYREYPDIYIDQITPSDNPFKLFFYQRIFLRAVMRYRYVYGTFTRAFSKSFLCVGANILRCIFFPGAKIFIAAGGKEQGANIAKEKIEEWLELFPILEKEIEKKQYTRDYVRIKFKNKSQFDIVAVKDSTRGGRRHAGTIEEVILVDGEKLNAVILPLMNVSRRAACGQVDPNEILNKSQTYITTAGYKNTFAYQKLIQILIWQVIDPSKAFVLGGSWRIPVMHGLLDKSFVTDLKADGTFNEMSFSREYESIWTGSVEDSFFNSDVFDKYRVIQYSEEKYSLKNSKNAYYILSVDVGRLGDKTIVMVFKVVPKNEGSALKYLVNIYLMEDEHFEIQSIKIKNICEKFQAKKIVIDGNGLGVGLLDYMVKPNIDTETGLEYQSYGVQYQTEEEEKHYKKFETDDTIKNMIYIIKATPQINNDMHVNALSQLSSGKIRLLIDHQVAKSKLLSTKKGQSLSPEERAEFLKPYTHTSILKEEMTNLREKKDTTGKIALERVNRKISKDRFSSFEYGLYYIKLQEDENKKIKVNLTNFILGTKNSHSNRINKKHKVYTKRGRNNV